MYGVVLWSDVSDKKAVIWCEDQGDLAYYVEDENSAFDGPQLDAGDLVHFQVCEGAQMRFAQNPALVSENHAPELADSLRAAMSDTSVMAAPVAANRSKVTAVEEGSENVLPFRLAFSA